MWHTQEVGPVSKRNMPEMDKTKQTLAKHNHHSLKHLILIPKTKIVRNLKFESRALVVTEPIEYESSDVTHMFRSEHNFEYFKKVTRNSTITSQNALLYYYLETL